MRVGWIYKGDRYSETYRNDYFVMPRIGDSVTVHTYFYDGEACEMRHNGNITGIVEDVHIYYYQTNSECQCDITIVDKKEEVVEIVEEKKKRI